MTVKRITFLQELLAFTGLEERVHLEWISSAEAQKFARVVTEFTEKIRSKGPNPLSMFSGQHPAVLPAAGLSTDPSEPVRPWTPAGKIATGVSGIEEK